MPSDTQWPARFRARHGRAPRILHIGNLANYAYVNALLMRRHGVDCVVLDPDNYHVASAPEWLEAEIAGDHGDDFYPAWRRAGTAGFRRPDWFLQGPTPFVIPQLAARERGRALLGGAFGIASRGYRHALGSRRDRPSAFRRFMAGEDVASRALKAAARAVARGAVRGGAAAAASAAEGPSAADDAMEPPLPPRVQPDLLRQALAGFDIILGYALGARYPLALGLGNVVSLELGTIRGLPFEATPQGRLCAWLYRGSAQVLVTNLDCLDAAARLGLQAERVHPIPHPFDVARAVAYARSPRPSPFAGPVPYFFAPARHHWRHGNASWLKGNDVLLRGAALAARSGRDFRIVTVDWGAETALSRALIDELGLADRVIWMPTTSRLRYWPVLAGAVAVIDQFAAPAFGGVALETMALGRRLVTRLAGTDLRPFFASDPPILEATTPDEVAARMLAVLDDPDDRAGHGAAGQRWMLSEHGEERQLALQFAAFERLLDEIRG